MDRVPPMPKRPAVDFLFIGPSKSGSSWIFETLRRHDEIFVPAAKDLYYFTDFFDRGADWYDDFFKNKKIGQIAGEICHDYLAAEAAAARIRAYNPEMKLITVLRDPFERALSAYYNMRKNGMTGRGVGEHLRHHPELVAEGYYATHLTRLFAHFPREQCLVLLFDRLIREPHTTAAAIFDFLGVSRQDNGAVAKRVRPRSVARAPILAHWGKTTAIHLRRLGMPGLVGFLKNLSLVNRMLYRESSGNYTEEDYRAFPETIRIRYFEEIDRTQDLLGIDLAHWKRLPR